MKKIIYSFSVLFCGALLVSAADDRIGGQSSSGPVVVEIDGVKLTAGDVEQKRSGSLFQARNNFYQAERKAVDEFVDDYIVEQQAKKEHLTVPQLFEKHVNSTIAADPSEEALRVYYEGLTTTDSFEKTRPQILEHVRQIRIEKAKTAYVKSLRAAATVSMRIPPPRVPISVKDMPLRGGADAKVMIVEYADYECPYCQQIQPTLSRIEADYKGKVAFAYKDVPLPMHSHAQKASEAAHCAGEQGKYWEYHDALFTNKQLDMSQLKTEARTLNLDSNKFDQCLDSGKEADLIKSTLAEAQAFQIQGTPSFFINGRFFAGNLSYEQLREIIEEEIGTPKTTASR